MGQVNFQEVKISERPIKEVTTLEARHPEKTYSEVVKASMHGAQKESQKSVEDKDVELRKKGTNWK